MREIKIRLLKFNIGNKFKDFLIVILKVKNKYKLKKVYTLNVIDESNITQLFYCFTGNDNETHHRIWELKISK